MKTERLKDDRSETIYYSDKCLAKKYSVCKATIWRWVKSGALPKPFKFSGGCTRWKNSDIVEFENSLGK
jgi:prophage regulatory protein